MTFQLEWHSILSDIPFWVTGRCLNLDGETWGGQFPIKMSKPFWQNSLTKIVRKKTQNLKLWQNFKKKNGTVTELRNSNSELSLTTKNILAAEHLPILTHNRCYVDEVMFLRLEGDDIFWLLMCQSVRRWQSPLFKTLAQLIPACPRLLEQIANLQIS